VNSRARPVSSRVSRKVGSAVVVIVVPRVGRYLQVRCYFEIRSDMQDQSE
jgi:hypothetical protein